MIQEILKEDIIQRDFYIKNLKEYLDSNVIKVLTGMRRTGKSYILKSIIKYLIENKKIKKENIFYINKELLDFIHIRDYQDLNNEFKKFLETANTNEKIFVGLDEVQNIKEWERFVNGCFAKYKKQIEIFITGSNSNMLSGELATLLTGRYIEFEIFPLSFDEYSLFSYENISKELFMEYIKYGGLPETLFMKKNDNIIFNYLNGVFSTILTKDIIKYFGVRNIDFFENLYKYVFANIGNIISANSISNYLKSQKIKKTPDVILNYIGYGLKAYMINLVKSTDPETKKYFEIYNKYYVGDLGLRNALVGFDFKKDIGKLLENYVFLELKRHGYDIKIGRLSGGEEIDFIAERYGVKKYFQVCYLLGSEETMEREYRPLKLIRDNWEKYVVSFDDFDAGIHEGIKHINVMNLKEVL